MFKIKIPDTDYFEKLVSCKYNCPVLTDARGYIQKISEGLYEHSYRIARGPNPFASICGRVCNAPCETACRRGSIDEPLAIRPLKRFVCERFGVEQGKQHYIKPLNKERANTQAKIAIIGAGPCGLSCAYELAILGYNVTVFEAQAKPGGMLLLGVPEYRLPRDVIGAEINAILDLGVELKTNLKLGRDFFIEDLKKEGFKAIFLAIGAHKSRYLSIDGIDLDGVFNAIDFLLNVNLGYKVSLGKKVAVIGGGSVAFDAARSAIRKEKDLSAMSVDELRLALDEARSALSLVTRKIEAGEDGIRVAMDVARQAMRLGSRDVSVYCLESKDEMPADRFEIDEALKEGVQLYPRFGPKKIIGKAGKVTGLELIRVKSIFDNEGRFNPVFLEGTEKLIEADTIILAIGQMPDLSFIQPQDNIKVSRKGTIEVDEKTYMSSSAGLFAGGDVTRGPRIIIEAVRDGRCAAFAIDEYLSGKRIETEKTLRWFTIKRHRMFENYDALKKRNPPTLPIDRRIGISEVEMVFPEDDAQLESRRCLRCNIMPIFDGERCVLCGGCVDVCPERCLRIVDVDKLSYELPIPEGFKTAMLKDEIKCIRCGLCADRCPTGAIKMERFEYGES